MSLPIHAIAESGLVLYAIVLDESNRMWNPTETAWTDTCSDAVAIDLEEDDCRSGHFHATANISNYEGRLTTIVYQMEGSTADPTTDRAIGADFDDYRGSEVVDGYDVYQLLLYILANLGSGGGGGGTNSEDIALILRLVRMLVNRRDNNRRASG